MDDRDRAYRELHNTKPEYKQQDHGSMTLLEWVWCKVESYSFIFIAFDLFITILFFIILESI